MAEPTSTTAGGLSLTTLAIAAFGPLAGPYALIVFAALAGALWPLSGGDPMTRKDASFLLVRCVLTAVILTVAISTVLQHEFGVVASDWYGLVALAIGALGNGWRLVFDALGGLISRIVGEAKK